MKIGVEFEDWNQRLASSLAHAWMAASSGHHNEKSRGLVGLVSRARSALPDVSEEDEGGVELEARNGDEEPRDLLHTRSDLAVARGGRNEFGDVAAALCVAHAAGLYYWIVVGSLDQAPGDARVQDKAEEHEGSPKRDLDDGRIVEEAPQRHQEGVELHKQSHGRVLGVLGLDEDGVEVERDRHDVVQNDGPGRLEPGGSVKNKIMIRTRSAGKLYKPLSRLYRSQILHQMLIMTGRLASIHPYIEAKFCK